MKISFSKLSTVFLSLFLAIATIYLIAKPGANILVSAPLKATTKAKVVDVDDSSVEDLGAVRYGTQRLRVSLPDGREFNAENELRAQMELDKMFQAGDTVVVELPETVEEDTVLFARDYWRIGWAVALFVLFSVLLCVFGGWTGLRALFTFFFSCLAIWKILIPAVLNGASASLVSFLTVAVLTGVIVFLVAGISRVGVSAFAGSMLGVAVSLVLAWFFSKVMYVDGAAMPFAQQLVNANADIVSLRDIFIGSVILGSSGAVMDLAMDIAAGMAEVRRHNPDVGFKDLFFSGCRIGRAVVGTMTTTLLLAYSGGYLTLLMVYASEGVRPIDFINSTLVSAEVVKTLVGSFGLVLVAPFTALAGAFVFGYPINNVKKEK
ncbi:MAG: YibE/F family protein [Kiritimatiellae bacterium]|nr:YibE/F family protein [Kiritimatiellia bacterium]